ncbi:hypothetical protein GALL_519070 [mine drainage metagenome]|uniref:Uncharacterized protein n=1 Tax=mine drainage metagenome TaxID=410659 RepID=A0A1J5P4N3_9ZZZZ
MQDRLYRAALALLDAGAVIHQTAAAPIAYRITHHGKSVSIPGGIVQQLLVSRRIWNVCTVNGRRRFLPT